MENKQLSNKEFKQRINNTKKAKTNPRLRYDETQNLTFSDFKRLALLLHGSYSKFGRAIGTDRANAKRILDGVYIPKKVATIEKIAKSFSVGLSPIIISKMFQTLQKSKKCENCGCELASDEVGWCDNCNLPERSVIQ